MLDEPAESFLAEDLAFRRRCVRWNQRFIVFGLMRTLTMIGVDELAGQIVQVFLTKDNESAQAFDFQGLDKSFRERIQIWTSHGKRTHFDAVSLHDRIEHAGELAVTITNQVTGSETLFLDVEAKVLCWLLHPLSRGVQRGVGDNDTATFNMNENEQVQILHALACPAPDRKELTGP